MDNLKGQLRSMVSKKKMRFKNDGFDLDLTYITDKIIAMGFPSSGKEGLYRNPIEEVVKFFETYHKGHYRIYNLCSEKCYDESIFNYNVERYPFDDHNAPRLLTIYPFLERINLWMNADPNNVAAFHCKAGKGRTGTIIATYLVHAAYREYKTAKDALELYGKIRTKNGKGVTIPSQMRYVRYYEYCLKDGFPMEDRKLVLKSLMMTAVPKIDSTGGCTPYLLILNQQREVVYDSRTVLKTKTYKKNEKPVLLSKLDASIQNDCKFILIEEKIIGKPQKILWFWINSNFIQGKQGETSSMILSRDQIDGVVKDKKSKTFSDEFKIELTFKIVSAGKLKKVSVSKSPDLGEPRLNQ
eukprot:gene7444-11767_t